MVARRHRFARVNSALPVILLVGGLGTRLRSLFPNQPKALAPIRGRPFLAWLLDWLRAQGLHRIHLATGYRAEQIAEWAAHYGHDGLSLSREVSPLGTGGGLRSALEHIAGYELLAMNGDSFLPSLDLAAWLAQPMPEAIDIEIAVTHLDAPGRYGTVEYDVDSKRIHAFLEKTERPAGWVNGGVYRFRRAALDNRPAHASFSLELDLFPMLAARGRLHARPVAPPLLDIGTPEGVRAMEAWLDANPSSFTHAT